MLRVLLVLLLLAPPARADNVAVIQSGNDSPYAEFSAVFREAIAGSNWKITAFGGIDSLDGTTERHDLIIAVGSSAFRQALARGGTTPILATLLPRLSYEKLLTESANRNRRVSAIWLDQPAARQAAFIRQLLPGKTRVGMLISNETRSLAAPFRQAFTNAGLTLDMDDSETDSSLLPALNALLSRVNVLLAIPDTSIYKRDSIRSILITTYRHQRPVVGFSAALVNAGALAALYSTPTQIARQSAEMLHTFGGTLPAPTSPNQFTIQINQNVAQALDLNLRDEAEIQRALLADKEAR